MTLQEQILNSSKFSHDEINMLLWNIKEIDLYAPQPYALPENVIVKCSFLWADSFEGNDYWQRLYIES